jgi:hypothetical protein
MESSGTTELEWLCSLVRRLLIGGDDHDVLPDWAQHFSKSGDTNNVNRNIGFNVCLSSRERNKDQCLCASEFENLQYSQNIDILNRGKEYAMQGNCPHVENKATCNKMEMTYI